MYSPTRFARWRLRLEADWAKHCVTSSNTGSGGKHQASKPPPPCLDRRRGDNCSSRNLHQMVQNSRRSIIISPCPISTHTHFNTSKAFWILPQTEIANHETRTRRTRLPQSAAWSRGVRHKLEDTRKHGRRVWWPKSFSIPLNEQLVQQLHYQNLDPGEAQTHHQLAAHHQISNSPYRPQVSISIKFHSFYNPKKVFFPPFSKLQLHTQHN